METWKVMARYHCYEVYKGRRPSIYNLWNEFKEQVNGYPNALYKGFTNPRDAMDGLSSYQLEVGIRTQRTRAVEFKPRMWWLIMLTPASGFLWVFL